MMLVPQRAQAYGNDYLENSDHYSAMITGAEKVHFKLPVYSRGTNDYYVSMNSQGESRVYYVLDGEWYTIFGYGSEHNSNGPSADDDVAYGRAWVKGYAGRGVLEITNCSDGQRKAVPSDNAEHSYNVTKKQESGAFFCGVKHSVYGIFHCGKTERAVQIACIVFKVIKYIVSACNSASCKNCGGQCIAIVAVVYFFDDLSRYFFLFPNFHELNYNGYY